MNASDHVSIVQQDNSLLYHPQRYVERSAYLLCASLVVDDAMSLPKRNDKKNCALQLVPSDTPEGMYGGW